MKKIIITLVFTTILLSCTNDHNNTVQKKDFTKDTAKEWYNSKFKQSIEWKENNESENIIPDWNSPTFRELDGLEVIEFPLIKKEAKIQTQDTNKLNSTALKIAFLKFSNDSIIIRKLYFIPESNYFNSNHTEKSNTSKYGNTFIGLLITKKWNNEVLSYKNIDSKNITELSIPKNYDNTKSTTTKLLNNEEPYAWYIRLGDCYIKGSQSKIDYWYYNYLTGKTDLYKGSYYNNNTYQYNEFYYPLPSGSTAATVVSTAQSIEDNITTPNLDKCAYDVLIKLMKTTNFDIATIFTTFGASTKMNLRFVTGVPPNGNAIATTTRTDPKTPFNYTITLTSDYSDGTQLFKATILIHELIHAYFMSLVDNYSRDQEFALFQNYPLLFQAYCDKKYPGGKESHHEEMANTYVNIMGSALQEFQTGKPAPNGIPDQIYQDLAWGGLQKTPVYDKKFPIGSVERTRIENVFGAESRGGYTNGYNPIGEKCK